jgi:hypothetical protein
VSAFNSAQQAASADEKSADREAATHPERLLIKRGAIETESISLNLAG